MATDVLPVAPVPIATNLRRFVSWVPSRAVVASAGELYLTREAHARMNATGDGRNPVRNMASAAFDQFVELGAAAHRLFADSWGRLGIAQLKVMSPVPGARLVGAFVDPQKFVGLRFYWRDELDFKATGQKGLINYKTLGREAAAQWDALLPNVKRMPMKEFGK